LGDDPRYADGRTRVSHGDEVDPLVEAWTEKHTKHEAMEKLGAAGVPCGAVLDSAEVVTNRHLIERGMIVTIEHPQRGRMAIPGNPVRMSDSPTEVTRAPLLGEHSAEVYGKLLGFDAAAVEALKKDGVI
jgi:formyl-CoA transferase